MNSDFEHRWKIGAAAAGDAAGDADSSPPFGFAARVVAQWKSEGERLLPLPALWQMLAMRVLCTMALVLVALAALDFWSGDGNSLRPKIEESVGEQLAWLN